ncbi:CotD family spore coat protein [Peribacillus acanthi]|uniref:CotD family spore coat protein n=1 Tax=Peribacillus acanthi TaxID=2171554 RepID=UPI0030B847BB
MENMPKGVPTNVAGAGMMGGYCPKPGGFPTQVSPAGMGPMGQMPSQVSPAGMGPMGPMGQMPSQVSPAGMGPVPTQVMPTVMHPTQNVVQQNVIKHIVPHVHPTHTTTVNHHVYQHQHYFPQTQSVVNQCSNQHLNCTGMPPQVSPIGHCPPRPRPPFCR